MNRQKGNAIFIILIGIALFAALSYAVTQSIRGESDSGAKEKTDIEATALLASANGIATAIKAMIAVNNCKDTEINFYVPNLAYASQFSNASAPSDKSCNVFALEGGGLGFTKPNKNIFDQDFSSSSAGWDWLFEGSRCIWGAGTGPTACTVATQSDLVAFLPYIKKDICQAINKKYDIVQSGYDVPAEGFSTERFNGTYIYNGGIIGASATATSLRNKLAGCFRSTTGGTKDSYVFYYTLLTR